MEEELKTILENSELDGTGKTEAIKKIVGSKYVPTDKYSELKNNKETEYNNLKAEYEQFKMSKMTEEEKRAELEKQRENEYKTTKITLNKMIAESTFSKAGFSEDDYKDILDKIVSQDSTMTKSLADSICGTMLKQKELIKQKLEENILKGTTPPPAGNADGQELEDKLTTYQKALEKAQEKGDMVKVATYTRLIQEEKNK